MGTQITKEQETLFSTNLFLYAVCPLLKTILEDKESLQKGWKGKKAVAQISCLDTGGKKAIHYLFENGTCTPKKGVSEEPVDIELEFKSPEHLCSFFKGKLFPLPKMKGALRHFSVFLNFMKLLLTMSGLLGAKTAPKKPEDQKLLVKCMFYLLSRGISILNKLGHPDVSAWAAVSPDRVYAWAVESESPAYCARTVPSCAISSSVRLPWMVIVANAPSSEANSFSVRRTSAASRFSVIRSSLRIPGMGTMKSFLWSIQAREI